ncbi:MAG TPA: putative baseplate assembly protein, partial [Blastocatellia bacterium]|nr:putative baseplate assembly protein [Blastocatellia bacterium]
KRLALDTPGVRAGRVEVMPRFKPQQRRNDVPGVITVMALPFKPQALPPNPRPDRPFIEAVHTQLSERRPVATELYVIGCEYVALGLSIGITIREGFGRDSVLNAVRDSLRLFLWPLAPGGIDGGGWPLGRSVRDREIEVVVARVPGVNTVTGVNLFKRSGADWQMIAHPNACAPIEMSLQSWQLPELLSVVVVADANPPDNLRGVPNPFGDQGGVVAVPVVPEVC